MANFLYCQSIKMFVLVPNDNDFFKGLVNFKTMLSFCRTRTYCKQHVPLCQLAIAKAGKLVMLCRKFPRPPYRSLRFFQNPKINKEICDQWLVTKYRQLHNFYTTKNVQIWSYELKSYILNVPNSTSSIKSEFKLQKLTYVAIFRA